MSNSHECMEVNGEALQLHAVYKITASHTRSVLNTTSHVRIRIRYCKSHASHFVWTCN